MEKKNLILTSTVGMTRRQWLDFRFPVFHIKKFILEQLFGTGAAAVDPEVFFKRTAETYKLVCQVFRSEEWKKFLFPCTGASEIASVMGLNQYKSIIELYYEKIGIKPIQEEPNQYMFWGKESEELLADKWQYWEGDIESLIRNHTAGNIVRKCRKINAYVQNKKFPWLFASLDRLINKYRNKPEGVLELKIIRWFAAQMWESGIPPSHVVQVQQQLAIFELLYGELAILQDGMTFDVLPFDVHHGIVKSIRVQGKAFFDKVKSGASHFIAYSVCPDEQIGKLHLAKCDEYSPEPDGSISYEKYLSQSYKDRGTGGIRGGVVELELAMSYKYYDTQAKGNLSLKRECSNKLKAIMKDASKMELGKEGTVTWKAQARGIRVLRVNVKLDDDFVAPKFLPSIKPAKKKEAAKPEQEFKAPAKTRKKKKPVKSTKKSPKKKK